MREEETDLIPEPNFCPLQPGKVKGIILTYHGKKLPAELTADSLEEQLTVG